ncbi:MAG: hypothetical protein PHH59_09505 [Methylovulum sp.]|uniref:hypothetical protein n=1 Tax=Methylovulum sp. TaxID=1916980 RepID=UPI002613CA8F|nr:hypothetical protein [Methylovulum sp.]MDD2724240.1 hypothetical protein [Methylovulum sp.]MDD5123027.1 hypothetical protein [Methylovulum sp.]
MKKLLLSLLAIILIIEEWLWELLSAFGHRLIVWLRLSKFERWLGQTSPGLALAAMMIPLLIVTPMNLAALWMLANGLILQGIALEVVAKLLGTLLISRVFALTKNQLLTFTVIAWTYGTITGWLIWAHAKITETAAYQLAQRTKKQVQAKLSVVRGYLRDFWSQR